MLMIIRSIDFETQAMTLQISGEMSVLAIDQLIGYLGYCGTLGITDVTLTNADGIGSDALEQIERHAGDDGVNVWLPGRRAAEKKRPKSDFLFTWRRPRKEQVRNRHGEYLLRLKVLRGNLKYINQFVLLVGRSLTLADRALSHLRLIVYELAVNSVEHAVFATGNPMIEVHLLSAGEDGVYVTYKDNALEFRTTDRGPVDMEEKMERREKRGLGLLLLRKMARNLHFERQQQWNTTRFSVDGKAKALI